jgi:PhnB protein
MSETAHVPPRTSAVTPYVCVRRCGAAIDWYAEVFGAVEDGPRYTDPDGRVGHAEIRIGGATVMLSDAYPDYGAVAPEDGVATATFALQLFVPDVDATVAAAERAGAQVQRPVSEAFHGSRMGTLMDPFGVRWMVGTHVRDPGTDELAAAAEQFATTGAEPGPLR